MASHLLRYYCPLNQMRGWLAPLGQTCIRVG
jgi:hypothetical protein